MELGRRRQSGNLLQKNYLTNPKEVATFLHEKLKDYQHEVFAIIFLNQSNKVNGFEIVSQGGITGTIADPRIILKKALEKNAVSIILCHNHPSGSLKPSHADETLTQKLKIAAGYLNIEVKDHIIVSESGYYSFANEGLL